MIDQSQTIDYERQASLDFTILAIYAVEKYPHYTMSTPIKCGK